jgi:hypothetical protein
VSRARVAGIVLWLAVCLPPGAAQATEVTAGELRRLAEQAGDSPGALRELRAVTSVDGQPAAVGKALGEVTSAELDARLAALAAHGAPAPGLRGATAQAEQILAQDRFHGDRVPGPFKGLLERLGDLVPRGVIEWLDDHLPGSRSVVWLVLAALALVAGVVVARRWLTRRIKDIAAAEHARTPAEADPRALERRAEAAEAAGELETALRLRFRAGLLRLDRRGAIEFRPSISTFEVRRAVRSRAFDRLADTFDDVVYGGREPRPEDVAEARERWPEVVR